MGSCLGNCLLKSESLLRRSGGDERHDFVFLINEKPVLELVDGLINPQSPLYSRLNESQRLPSTSTCCSHDIPMQCLDARALLAKTRTSTPASSIDLEWEHETLPISMVHDPSATSSWTAFPGDDLTTDPCISCGYDDVTPTPSLLTSHHHNNNNDANTTGGAEDARSWSRISSANSLEWDNNVPAHLLLHHATQDGVVTASVTNGCEGGGVRHGAEVGEGTARDPISGDLFEHVELDEADTLQLLSEIERLTERTLLETGRDLDGVGGADS